METNYSYEKHGNCRYVGKCLLIAEAHNGNIFIIREHYLVKNKDNVLGYIGHGVKWFLNFVVNKGSWAFNPINEDKLLWSPFHRAYVLKTQLDHFKWPCVINEGYLIDNGKKYTGPFYTHGPMQKLPTFKFETKSKYI